MSDWSDSSSDSDVLPDFSFLESWDEEAEKKAGTGRTKQKRCPMGMWYYNLSERQRRAEDERIARELAHVEADFREVQKFEITYAPIEYRTRGSSLSPRTPPPRVSSRPSPQPSTSRAGLPESFCGAHLPRRVTFRLTDGSSSDDEGAGATRRSSHRIVSSSDDDNGASAPRTLEGSVADSSTLNKDPGESSSGVVQLSKDRETSGALLYSILDEEAGGESDAGRASSSLTKADVVQRRRKRIEERQNLVEEMSSGSRSSSDKSTLKRSILQTFVITPKSRRISGRISYVPRTLYAEAVRATPSPKSSSEESPASLEQREPRPLFYLSSAASSFTDEPARSTSTPVGMLYSTPLRVISLPDTSAAHAPHYPRGLFVTKAASADRTQRAGRRRRRQVLDRGETHVLAKLPEPEALTQPSTEDSTGHQEAPTTPEQAHPEANTAEHLPDDTTMVVPPPTAGQQLPLALAHEELPQTPAEEPSDSPPALRRSQRAQALTQPSTEDSTDHQEAPTTPEQAHPEANTAEHLPDDTTMVVPPPTAGQQLPLALAHEELPQTPAEEPSDSPPALRRSQRARFAAAGSISRGAQPPKKSPSAALSPVPHAVTSDTRPPQASRRHDERSTSQTSVGSANSFSQDQFKLTVMLALQPFRLESLLFFQKSDQLSVRSGAILFGERVGRDLFGILEELRCPFV
ncbi:hypothetical protein HPB52_006049 [Rhipicephalus sanguineus]|uniref:Uncharacterized protein n=1 Tax=Rhipicephalus sanguineus TaxID=34632 RepID=A0A9D4QGX2_RHISA|nr:hypothetical protein HPB52_006049 [Rhipicephalus sanguineus]